jgi:hypothetical protein
MAIVQVSGDLGITETTGCRYAWCKSVSGFVIEQPIEDADEDGHPIPAHKSRAGIDPVVTPNDAPVFVFSVRMKYMLRLPHVEHVKQFRWKLEVIARVPLL